MDLTHDDLIKVSWGLRDIDHENFWAIRASSQLALALIAQTARDLLLPVTFEAGLTRWQYEVRRQNAVYQRDALNWVNDRSGSPCLSLSRCCDVINAVLGEQSLHIDPESLRNGLLHYPEHILRWAASEKESISKQRRSSKSEGRTSPRHKRRTIRHSCPPVDNVPSHSLGGCHV